MRVRSFFQILPLLGLPLAAPAQELLELNLANRCIFHTLGQEEELYSFTTKVRVMDDLVADVLRLGGDLEQNFTVVQANVENVSAVVDGPKRYLLWSQDFLEKTTPTLAYASVAHEIGHHANLHQLTADRRDIEEREADVFMGFVLGMKNVPLGKLLSELRGEGILAVPSSRQTAIGEGYEKAEKSLKISGLQWEHDPSWDNFQRAAFPFPPPQCYQSASLSPASFGGCATLGDLGKKIGDTFNQKGYPHRFMSVPEGFAVVTQLEQYQEDGGIYWDGKSRWQELPPAENFAFSMRYFKSLILPRKAYLRVFVVLVTRQNYSSQQGRISKDAAKAWASQGVNRLPKSLAALPFNDDYSVDVLVYEFEVPETNRQPQQHCPCHLDARRHLEKAGLGLGY